MVRFRNPPLQRKLVVALVLVALFAAGVGAFGVATTRPVAAANRTAHEHTTVPFAPLGDMATAVPRARVTTRDGVRSTSAAEAEPFRPRPGARAHEVDTLAAASPRSILRPEIRQRFTEVGAARTHSAPLRASAVTRGVAGQDRATLALPRGPAVETRQAASVAIDSVQVSEPRRAAAHAGEDDLIDAAGTRATAGVVAGAVLLALAAVGELARRIAARVGVAAARTAWPQGGCVSPLRAGILALARGDLAVHVVPSTMSLPVAARDEVGARAATFDRMPEQVQATIIADAGARGAARWTGP